MHTAIRGMGLAFSLLTHVLLLGGFVVLAHEDKNAAEQEVYRVSLATLSQPSAPAQPAPPAPEIPEPVVPEPEVIEPPKPEPEPEAKTISPQKQEKPKPKQDKPKEKKPKPKPRKPVQPRPAAAPANQSAVASTAPAGPTPRNVGGFSAYESAVLDQPPSITRQGVPQYPSKARRMNIQGRVLVELVVDTAGKPHNCVVVAAKPQGYFEDAALEAARKMRFAPGKLKGRPVNTLVRIPFLFKLR